MSDSVEKQTMGDIDKMVQVYEEIAPLILSKTFPTNACISTTRVTVDVFTRLGFRAEPLACFVIAYNLKNPKKRIECGLPGRPSKFDRYNGHLVAIIENKYLVDGSISQFERPEIPLPNILIRQVNRKFRRGNTDLRIEVMNDSVVIYQPTFEDGSWKFMPGWSAYPITTEKILKGMNWHLN